MFPAYGAQIVHMPFATSLPRCRPAWSMPRIRRQRLFVNKHYEWRRSCSMSSIEANNNLLWISDKL